MSDSQPPRTTTDAGIPAGSHEHSLTVGPDGQGMLMAAGGDSGIGRCARGLAIAHVGAPLVG